MIFLVPLFPVLLTCQQANYMLTRLNQHSDIPDHVRQDLEREIKLASPSNCKWKY